MVSPELPRMAVVAPHRGQLVVSRAEAMTSEHGQPFEQTQRHADVAWAFRG